MANWKLLILILVFQSLGQISNGRWTKFPENFSFGVATSSVQIEGAWNISGKGVSIWDQAAHSIPTPIKDGSNFDVAADSYDLYKVDVKLLKELGVDCYRFSLSWTRICPQGYANIINPDGVRYYNELIDLLILNNIEPVVTIFHWDMPVRLQQLGGWPNDRLINIYVNYADKVFELFGDRVKTWSTMNEPTQYCRNGYSNLLAPFYNNSGEGGYLCAHNVIRAHARAYRLYQRKYKETQKGKVGITCDTFWYEPLDESSQLDRDAANRAIQFYFGWFIHPIFSRDGDYPEIMRTSIDFISRQQGFPRSRLPYFTRAEIKEIRGAGDFIGLNHYSTFLASPGNQSIAQVPNMLNDVNVETSVNPNWEDTAGGDLFKVVPWGLRRLLNWIKNEYGADVEIVITENGYCGFKNESLNDDRRINYLNSYLNEVLNAINDGVNVTAYTWWAFIDTWEWTNGYNFKFGFYSVDFDDPNRKRTAKKSAYIYKNIATTRKVDESYDPPQFYQDLHL